ncbi:hypothetical protein RRG08_019773 [Elysia crispata]|uniref:Uncharacterized protein n=1 Tax=Elysia crispata TaxID=231223 RepID=A0AAE1AW18_9GAST|nr:hypothetical protein RRG08_019773 [Elysia crispata]
MRLDRLDVSNITCRPWILPVLNRKLNSCHAHVKVSSGALRVNGGGDNLDLTQQHYGCLGCWVLSTRMSPVVGPD